MIAIQHPGATFFPHPFVHQYHLLRLIETGLLFTYHGYSVRRTYLRAYSAALAIFHIYLDGYGSANNSIWTIEPAQKTGSLVLSSRETLFLVYHWKRVAPLACLTCFTDSR
jgi:hypothetical protein